MLRSFLLAGAVTTEHKFLVLLVCKCFLGEVKAYATFQTIFAGMLSLFEVVNSEVFQFQPHHASALDSFMKTSSNDEEKLEEIIKKGQASPVFVY